MLIDRSRISRPPAVCGLVREKSSWSTEEGDCLGSAAVQTIDLLEHHTQGEHARIPMQLLLRTVYLCLLCDSPAVAPGRIYFSRLAQYTAVAIGRGKLNRR